MRRHTLDGLRGVAALVVVLLHEQRVWGMQIAPGGYLAVDVFFALSGFVIAQAYDKSLAEGMTTTQFMTLRLIRLYPLYLVGLMIGLVRAFAMVASHAPQAPTIGEIAIQLAASLFYIPVSYPPKDLVFFLNPPAWSLFFELVVNLLFAVFFRYLTAVRLMVIVALSFCWLAVLTVKIGNLGELGIYGYTLFGGLLRAIFGFGLGILIFRNAWRFRAPPLAIVALLLVMLMLPVADSLRPFFDLGCLLVVIPAVVIAGSASESAALTPIFSWLGNLSYCIYAIHYPLVQMSVTVVKRLPVSGLLLGISVFAGLLVICPVIDAKFDQPVRKMLRDRLIPKRGPAGAHR